MWSVVHFLESEEVEVVPSNWIVEDEEIVCWWPGKKLKVKDLVQICGDPGEGVGWDQFRIRILGSNYASIELARKKLLVAVDTSDLNSESEGCARKRIKKQIYSPTSNYMPKTHTVNKQPSLGLSFQSESEGELDEASEPLPFFIDHPTNNLDLCKPLFDKKNHGPSNSYSSPLSKTPVGVKRSAPVKSPDLIKLSTKKPKKSNEPADDDEEWKLKVIRMYGNLKLKLDAIYEMLKELPSRDQRNSDDVAAKEFSQTSQTKKYDLEDFPLQTIESLQVVEDKLINADSCERLAIELSKIGGTNVKDTTKRILRRLFTDQLAQEYSYHGFKKKLVFSILKLRTVIFDAVRRNKVTQHATGSEIETAIKDWLRLAKARFESKNHQRKSNIDHQLPQENN